MLRVEAAVEDADDRSPLACNQDRLVDDLGVGAELTPPNGFAEHGDSRRAGPIFVLGKRPAFEDGRMKEREETPAHARDRHLFRKSGLSEVRELEPVRGHIVEAARLLPDVECAQTDDPGWSALVGLGQPHDAIGVRRMQRPKQYSVRNREDGAVRADAQSHRGDDGERKCRLPPSVTDRVRRILPDALEPRRDPDRTRVLTRERGVAERAASGPLCVERHFFRELGVAAPLCQEVVQTTDQFAHHASDALSSTRRIAAIRRSNSRRSDPSCLRPDGVSV